MLRLAVIFAILAVAFGGYATGLRGNSEEILSVKPPVVPVAVALGAAGSRIAAVKPSSMKTAKPSAVRKTSKPTAVPTVKRNQPTSEPTKTSVAECPQLPALDQVPGYGYVSMGSTGRLANFCESPFYFPYKCGGWMTAATEAKFKLSEPTFAVAEHYIEWEDDAKGSLSAALTNDLTSALAGNAIVKFVDAFAFKSECIVINKHRKNGPLNCKKQCYEPGNWGTNQVVYFSKYARGNKIRLNFYMRSSLNSVAITTSGAITTVSGFKTALTYVYNNQASDLQAMSYEAAIQFAPQSSEFVNLLAGYPGTKPVCSYFDVLCHIVGAPKPKKEAMSAFAIIGAGVTDVIGSSSGPQ